MRWVHHYFALIMAVSIAFGALGPAMAVAQTASPVASLAASPVANGQPVVSETRAQAIAALAAAYPLEPATNTDGALIEGATSDVQSVNPLLVSDGTTVSVVRMIFESLIANDPKTGQPIPGPLLDRYEIAGDGVTYTFHLNANAVWHDGAPFTAADVAFTFDAINDVATLSPYTGAFKQTVASWQVIDDHTLVVASNSVSVQFLSTIASTPIIAKHIWENVARKDFGTDPGATGQDAARVIGTGPMRFKTWTQGDRIELARNDAYYEPIAGIKTYTLRFFPDAESRFNAFLKGEIDDVALDSSQAPTVAGNADFATTTYDVPGFIYYEFNLDPAHGPLFQDARVRQAFMYALDRNSIVKDILGGAATLADGPQPSLSYAYDPTKITTKYDFNPEKAKALLAAAGWTDTNGDGVVDKAGVPLKFDFLYNADSPSTDTLVTYLQSAWKAVGIDAAPKPLDFSTLIQTTTGGSNWDLALYGFSWDATFIQSAMFACNQHQVGFNDMSYCNPALDALFTHMGAELNEAKRVDLMTQAANIVNDDQPVGILYFNKVRLAWSTRLHNIFPSPWGTFWNGPGISAIWADR